MISFQHALPLSVFLIVSFLAFYFTETIILFVLNFLIRRHWKFVVDRLLRTVVRHRTLVRALALGSIAGLIILLFCCTSLADLLVANIRALRLLALILLLTMIVIYLIGARSLTKVVIERRIHLYVFTVLSILSFTGVMALAGEGYATYEERINAAFVAPILENIEENVEAEYTQRIEGRLLEIFKKQIQAGECEDYDYADETGTGLIQFVFVKKDPTLAVENPETRAIGEPLAGKRCVHQTKFLLTPEGKWYEVLEQKIAEETKN